jgi:F0F1-type ATP synthase assembly protein I
MKQENKENRKSKSRKYLDSYARYSSIAFQMLAIILVGVFGGIKLDEWLKLNFPVFTIALTVLSVILAIYYSVKDFIKSDKNKGSKKKSNG